MLEAITPRLYPIIDISPTAEFILSVQKKDGEIPWSTGGWGDPWDHVESAMGLTIGGYYEEARKAYLWSAGTQMEDGSWWSFYMGGQPEGNAHKDTNMTAYLAVGLLHYFLATEDHGFLRFMWNPLCKAMDFAVGMQGPEGEMFWAKRQDGSIDETALLTGSSSIYMSLTCALRVAAILGKKRPRWEAARMMLGNAIRHKPHLFDGTKARFSMDWYYPVLCGALMGNRGLERIRASWNTFTVPDWGVLCVSDQSWVTMAETSELAIALAAMGQLEASEMVLGWIQDKKYDDGAYWTGVTMPDGVIYTQEKTAWTAAAVLLAADILYDLTPAAAIFRHEYQRAPFSSGPSKGIAYPG